MKYETITDYCGKLNPGKLEPEKQSGDGSEEKPYIIPYYEYDETVESFISDFYRLYESLPENSEGYMKILENNGIEMGNSLETLDVSGFEPNVILNIMMTIIRQDRFCEGLINRYIKNGCMENWLSELKKTDL